MRSGPALLLMMLATLGCGARRAISSSGSVAPVTALTLDFPARDRGLLSFALSLPGANLQKATISWELFLEGVRFASGVESEGTVSQGVLEVGSRLAFRQLAWREGEGVLEAVLQGTVELGEGRELLTFRDLREVRVSRRPRLRNPLD